MKQFEEYAWIGIKADGSYDLYWTKSLAEAFGSMKVIRVKVTEVTRKK